MAVAGLGRWLPSNLNSGQFYSPPAVIANFIEKMFAKTRAKLLGAA
ncbi:hypothetical protein CCC_03180 [Paramagnetospirillum magnetotacticum MS-1]|uniref:Uncharacterized protein n=1 Tax=Paramagnetospirillum magnetotacticum MS-1 TaxID=272627 RepID=A0A0C2UGB6_PARME|nr:hypothetical protein [Paramagnetospirillum magnetotacticum]KIM00578.1 hypothetical protein CCC_03180 [Paramagnetospirillum magnetotacticum MS-1]